MAFMFSFIWSGHSIQVAGLRPLTNTLPTLRATVFNDRSGRGPARCSRDETEFRPKQSRRYGKQSCFTQNSGVAGFK